MCCGRAKRQVSHSREIYTFLLYNARARKVLAYFPPPPPHPSNPLSLVRNFINTREHCKRGARGFYATISRSAFRTARVASEVIRSNPSSQSTLKKLTTYVASCRVARRVLVVNRSKISKQKYGKKRRNEKLKTHRHAKRETGIRGWFVKNNAFSSKICIPR